MAVSKIVTLPGVIAITSRLSGIGGARTTGLSLLAPARISLAQVLHRAA